MRLSVLIFVITLMCGSSVDGLSGVTKTTTNPRHGSESIGFTLHLDQAQVLTRGTALLPPMTSVPCSGGGPLREIVKPPNVDDLYTWYTDVRGELDADPSWGVIWSTAVSLSQYLLATMTTEEESIIKSKHVVELGCGIGLCGLVAASLGATSVMLTDKEPFALHCAMSTAAVNQLPGVQATILDWTNEDDTSKDDALTADVVLASDVLYDKKSIGEFSAVCKKILSRSDGGIILVADPLQERCKGAREMFRTAMMGDSFDKDPKVELVHLPLIESSGARGFSLDALDHARRMQEPTVLIKCEL